MRRFIASLITIVFSINVWAGEVWVTFSQLSSKEKLEALAEDRREQLKEGDFISSFDALLSHPVAEETLSAILKNEDEAQAENLNGHFYKSLKLYKNLKTRLENVPNVSGIERITFSTLIHIAELHDLVNDGEGMVSWRQAHAWDPQKLSQSVEFSPKSTAKFNTLKLYNSRINLEVICPLEGTVFIDGKKIPENQGHFRKNLELGYHHVDVLVPGSEWMSKSIFLKSQESRDLTFRPEPLVEGTCDDPHFIGSPLPKKTKLLVNFGACDRIYYEKNWFNVAGRRIESLVPGPSASTITSEILAPPEEKTWLSKTVHSNWFWIGLGAVAVGAVALTLQSQNQQTIVTPTNSFK